MSGRLSEDGEDAATVRLLAMAFGWPLREEHVAEVSAAWRMMQPHLQRVRHATLASNEEPAAFFDP